MSVSEVSVPIPTKKFLELAHFLQLQGSDRDVVDAIHAAIDYWMENAPKQRDITSSTPNFNPSMDFEQGYYWKELFIPSGSKVKIIYKGRRFEADVRASGIDFNGRTLSPSSFVHQVTRTTRNAWNDIEIRFPDSEEWVPANTLRRKLRG